MAAEVVDGLGAEQANPHSGQRGRRTAEVETTEYDIEELKTRRRGRPLLGRAPAEVVTVRINPELRAASTARAEKDGTTVSAVHREALRRFLLQP